jgi:hypothetical protein
LTLKLLKTLETKSRFNTLEFALIPPVDGEDDEGEGGGKGEEVLAVGTEKGLVEVYSVSVGGGDEDDEDDEEDEDEEDEEENGTEGKGGKDLADVEMIGTLAGHTNRSVQSPCTFRYPAEVFSFPAAGPDSRHSLRGWTAIKGACPV